MTKAVPNPLSQSLNQSCLCITLDRTALFDAIGRETSDASFCDAFMATRPHLFSNAPVFVSAAHIAMMMDVVKAIETATQLPGYRDAILEWAPAIARTDFGPHGVFMGYDFHLGDGPPKLIEINTNAGGAFLNAMLARAQRACCSPMDADLVRPLADEFEAAVVRMIQDEWASQRRNGELKTIAIIDDQPKDQYLYPEFVLAQRLLERNGFDAMIVDPVELAHDNGRLTASQRGIDLVYNRLVDFSLQQPEHGPLRAAYLSGDVVVTPNPRNHALFADKRNLILLSDPSRLRGFGLAADDVARLVSVPRTVQVSADAGAELWENRRRYFFKPASGHGGKAVYRGDKITKRVWANILDGAYVAQEYAPPGARSIKIDGATEQRKVDVRLYTYRGELLLAAARLYQGQTTNFRTPGGGFAPVFVV